MRFVTREIGDFQSTREMRVDKAPSTLKLVCRSQERFVISAILADSTKLLLGVCDPQCEIELKRSQDMLIVFEGPDEVDCFVQSNARDQKVEPSYETFTSLEVNRLSAEERAMKMVEREINAQRQHFERQLARQRQQLENMTNGLQSGNVATDKAGIGDQPGMAKVEDDEVIEPITDGGEEQSEPPS